MFPDPNDLPAVTAESLEVLSVASSIAFYFLFPIRRHSLPRRPGQDAGGSRPTDDLRHTVEELRPLIRCAIPLT